MKDLLINDTEQKQTEKKCGYCIACALFCFCSFAVLTSLNASSMIEIYKINEIASPVHSFIGMSPPEKDNCTIWQYDGGFWPPQDWPSVVGNCECARGSGCHCYIQGCGQYKEYNYSFNVIGWLLLFTTIISAIALAFSCMVGFLSMIW